MPQTAIIVGSLPIAEQAFTVSGNAAELAPGSYYLRHPTLALSLVDQVALEIGSAATLVVLGFVREDLRVQLNGAGAFSVTWGSATVLRDLLGFTQGDLSSASSHTAASISPMLWSPTFLATPATRRGKAGYTVPHRTDHKADDGSAQETQYYGQETWQELEWSFVPSERVSVEDGSWRGGTFEGLYEAVLKYRYRLRYHEDVVEIAGSADPLDWNDSQAFGPYQLRADPGRNANWYERMVPATDDVGGPIALQLHLVTEYG